MKRGILKIFIAILLIIVLTSINMLFLGYNLVVSLANEIEKQVNNTNINNVKFDAYFKNENATEHYRKANISEQEIYLYINVNVQGNGSVENAKIKINDSNFKIKENNILNSYIKNINLETNEIELNSIIYGNNVELEIPIEFKFENIIDEKYFSKETNISLEGTYKNEEAVALQGNVTASINWTDNAEIAIAQAIEKCIDLGQNGTLIQQKIETSIINGNLPRQNEQLVLDTFEINGLMPESVEVLLNGIKLEQNSFNYDKESKKLIIYGKQYDEDTQISWDNKNEEYKIIYIYNTSIKNNLPTINLHTEIKSKLFTRDEIVKSDEQQIKLELGGNVVSLRKEYTQEIYKGYLYANSQNITTYTENNIIEISNANFVESIKTSTNPTLFIDAENRQYNALVSYKETLVNKDEFIRLFGEDGYINIKDLNGNLIYGINNQAESDENGYIHVIYSTNIDGIIVETSKPIEEGKINIQNVKNIQSNTGYSRKQLRTFEKLIASDNIETNLDKNTVQADITLQNTKTEVELEVSNTNLSTLHKNENVQFTITFKTPNESYDLFKNPVLELKLPNNIKNINVNSINKVYADEFEVEYARLQERGNEKYIQIALNGEQKDYAKEINEMMIVIDTNIEFDILTPSQKSQIIMKYSNENGNRDIYEISKDINIESKSGLMMYSILSGYNSDNETIYTIDDSVPVGMLDLGSSSKTAQMTTAIINNYTESVNDLVIIGKIPSNGIKDGTIDTSLVQGISTNLENVQILYSQNANALSDDNSWTEDITNARAYKITLQNMEVGQIITIQYKFVIPEKIGYGQSIFGETIASYIHLENANIQSSAIGARTDRLITNNILTLQSTETINEKGLDIAISTVSGGSELKENDIVYEGQHINYTIQITNNTGVDLTNVNIKAVQSNGKIYDLIEEEAQDPTVGEDTHKFYHRYEELNTNEKQFDLIDILPNGESVILQYEIVASEINEEIGKTNGNIIITTNEIDEITTNTIENQIKQAELKLTMQNARYEEETLYSKKSTHMNLTIENISGDNLKNLKGQIKLPDGIYCEDSTKLNCDSVEINGEDVEYSENTITNLSYDKENNIFTFEIPNMEAQEKIIAMLYIQVDEFQGSEKDFSFMYQIQGENTYISNLATITIVSTQRNIILEQTASIDENYVLEDEDKFDIVLKVENNENQELYFQLSDIVPEGLTVKSGSVIYDGTKKEIPIISKDMTIAKEQEDLNVYDNILTLKQYMKNGTNLEIILSVEVDAEYITERILTNVVKLTYGEKDPNGYYEYEWSNNIEQNRKFQLKLLSDTVNESNIEISQVGNPENNSEVKDKQDISYTFNIQNKKSYDVQASLYDYLPNGFVAESIVLDGNQLTLGDVIVEDYTIKARETSILEVSGYIDETKTSSNELVNNLTVTTISENVTSNNIVYTLLREGEEIENPENPDNPDLEEPDVDEPNNPNPDESENPSENERYTISGVAWNDSNKDGKRDYNEQTLSGIEVKIIDVDEGKYIDNINVVTSQNGYYEVNVNPGNYILIFDYDTELYRLTEYMKAGISENENSDVISRNITINGENNTLGATDVIEVSDSNIENIDIGLIQVSTFDLELNKYITQIVVDTNKKTSSYTYNNTNLAKIEIHSKELNDATVTIKYTIQVMNTGDATGYIQSVIDYLPSDLEFDEKLNPDWNYANGYLYNNSLSNTAMLPGQVKNMELTLVKKMNNENTGTVINTAEIQKTSNFLGLIDIDSTPGNNNPSEDDYGKAEVIISVGTGLIILYISIIFIMIVVIGVSIYFINKKILKKDQNSSNKV